jgi:anti-sigma-K factor RskA
MSPELHALAGAYALDALETDERAEFEGHLAGCEDCAEEVRSFHTAAAELTHLTEVAPPAQLRTDVLDAISRVRPLAPPTDSLIDLRRAPRRKWVWQLTAAACALIAIIAGIWGYQQHQDARRAHTAVGSSAIETVLNAPDATAISGPVGTGHATVLYSKSEKKVVLIGRAIPALPKDKSYQLWLVSQDSSGKPIYISAGTFAPDASGNVSTSATGDLSTTAKMGISIEPAGGSPQPTDVIAAISL